jgi:hypothetical protein
MGHEQSREVMVIDGPAKTGQHLEGAEDDDHMVA